MKTLLLTSVVALALALPLSSNAAGINALGVQLPVERHEVSESTGGYVAQDFGDTLNVQKLNSEDTSVNTEADSDEYLVFGVDINSINNS